MQDFTIELDFVRETKGTVVYGSEEEGIEIKTLYISKTAFNDARGPFPQSITVSVTES